MVHFVGYWAIVMIKRNGRGDLYLIVRGEIPGFIKDKLKRTLFTGAFSLIKNES